MAQYSLERMRRYGITPATSIGQHFLVDDNILDVVMRLANLSPGVVVLEPGPGLGVLTERLLNAGCTVHAIELDERMKEPLADLQSDHPSLHVSFGDVLNIDTTALQPPPTAIVSNLPYSIAAPLVAESIVSAPQISTWCVMVQREVADRFFASVGASDYGALSVLVQAACERTGFHPVSRFVFAPPPNVDSALVAFRRRENPLDASALRTVARAAFAHRRKTLANNLRRGGWSAQEVESALAHLELAPTVRPQELSPEQFITLSGLRTEQLQ